MEWQMNLQFTDDPILTIEAMPSAHDDDGLYSIAMQAFWPTNEFRQERSAPEEFAIPLFNQLQPEGIDVIELPVCAKFVTNKTHARITGPNRRGERWQEMKKNEISSSH
jgi:hypothetical protein